MTEWVVESGIESLASQHSAIPPPRRRAVAPTSWSPARPPPPSEQAPLMYSRNMAGMLGGDQIWALFDKLGWVRPLLGLLRPSLGWLRLIRGAQKWRTQEGGASRRPPERNNTKWGAGCPTRARSSGTSTDWVAQEDLAGMLGGVAHGDRTIAPGQAALQRIN